MDRFGVSIKGIIEADGKYLLRKNERCEYELLGGRLEKGDASAEMRLITEFKEESGIKIEVLGFKEPWLYEIGLKNIIIVPFMCRALSIPDVLEDEDGGTLHWINKNEIDAIFMPQGYKDNIRGKMPHKSYSIPAKSFFKIIPNYVERDYYVEINVLEKGVELLRTSLPHFHSPRDFIFNQLGEKYKDANLDVKPISIDYKNDKIVLNYSINL